MRRLPNGSFQAVLVPVPLTLVEIRLTELRDKETKHMGWEAAYDALHIIKLAGLHSNTTAKRSGISCLNTLPAFITYCSTVLGSLIIDFGNASKAEANFPIARYREKDQTERG